MRGLLVAIGGGKYYHSVRMIPEVQLFEGHPADLAEETIPLCQKQSNLIVAVQRWSAA